MNVDKIWYKNKSKVYQEEVFDLVEFLIKPVVPRVDIKNNKKWMLKYSNSLFEIFE